MATETVEPITSQNVQQFNDDDIVDNFGAAPERPDGSDDGVPLGLGGEQGKQATPASSTLEADMAASPTRKQEEKPLSGDALPPDDAAVGGGPKPVQDTADDGGGAQAAPQATAEPEAPEYPAMLLQMAGFSTPQDAQKAGFKDPESLFAAVQLIGSAFSKPVNLSRSSYVEPKTPEIPPTQIPAEKPPKGDDTAFPPFKPDNPDIYDERLLALLESRDKQYAAHFQQQQRLLEETTARLRAREQEDQQRQQMQQIDQFDRAVQELGKDWEAEFGQGPGDVLFGRTDAESVAAGRNRVELLRAVQVLRQANAEQGGKPMSPSQELQWALMQRHPEKFKQQLRLASEAKVSSRRGVQASRPTARRTPLGTKNEQLLSTLQAKYPAVDFSQGDSGGMEEI